MSPRDVDALPSTPADVTASYGPDDLQFGELRLPKGDGPFPPVLRSQVGWMGSGSEASVLADPAIPATTQRQRITRAAQLPHSANCASGPRRKS